MTTDARRRDLRAAIAVLVTVIALVSGACRSSSADDNSQRLAATKDTGGEHPVRGGRMVVALPMETNGWNPFMNQWGDAPTLAGSTMIEPLAIQENDGTPKPWLAERWESNDDFTQWDITLRQGVRFHDNTPFNAQAAKKSLEMLYQSGLYSFAYGPLYDHVQVTGEYTVRVFLKLHWAHYPTSLPFAWMLAPAMVDRPDQGTSNPIGTGPFRFQRWTAFNALSVVRFDGYWRKDREGQPLPYLNEIEFPVIGDAPARASALQTGDVDFALSAGGDISADVDATFQVIKDYSTQRTYLALNTAAGLSAKPNPFSNIHARRAVAYAVDRQRLARSAGAGVESTPYGYREDGPWAPAGGHGYVDHDPAIAHRELETYKKDTGAKSLAFQLNASSATDVQETMQALGANLAEVGITVTINAVDMPKSGLLSAMGDYHALLARTHDFLDPDQEVFYYSASAIKSPPMPSLNFSRYTSPKLEADLKVIRESTDQAKRKQANDDLIRETNDNVVNVWLYNTPESIVASRHVRGIDGFRTHVFANALPKPWLAEAYLR
jgi:peptide/nickel transport system substrate-binding protein